MSNSTIKKLGFWSIVLFGVNSIIGTGIFLTPGDVIKQAGTLAPVSYIIAGLFATVIGIVFATAAKYVKTNGAAYAYTTAAFGPNVGIYVGVTRAISASIAWGVLATAVVKTLFEIFYPIAANPYHNYFYLAGLIVLVGILLAINLFGTQMVKWASNISTIGKLTALVLFVLVGLFIIMAGTNHFMEAEQAKYPAFKLFGSVTVMDSSQSAGVLVAIITALYAFTGFENIATAAEEMEDPEKNLPRAIPVTLAIVAVAYLSVVVTGMFIDPKAIVASQDTVKLAAVLNGFWKTVIVLGAAVSMFGINIAASFSSPRIWSALADNGAVPQILTKKNNRGVPVFAFAVTAGLALLFPIALRFDVSSLAGLSVIVRFIQFVLVPIAVMKMAMSKNKQWINVKRNQITEFVLPILAILASLVLISVYNYPSILFNSQVVNGTKVYDIAYGWNSLSIFFLVTLLILVPAAVYVYYYSQQKRKKNI